MRFGAIINAAGILLGGLGGHLFARLLKERHQQTLNMACGISVLFIGIAGAMEGMLQIKDGGLTSGQAMLTVICLTLGGLLGEIIDLEDRFERFGDWLKQKTGNGGDNRFTEGFVTASLTVCIGAMAVVGSIRDGLTGDCSILVTKTILDVIIVMIMTCSLGKGCAFSALPVLVIEGVITLLATLLRPVMTDTAMAYLSMIGSVPIFCVGVNLVCGKKIRVANLLPALILAVAAAFLPFAP